VAGWHRHWSQVPARRRDRHRALPSVLRDLLSAFVLSAALDAALPLDVDKFVDDDSDPDAPERSARVQ
jgi:hypothetical protein